MPCETTSLIVIMVLWLAASGAAAPLAAALAPAASLAPSLGASGKDQGNAQAQYFYSLDPQRGAYSFAYDTGSAGHQSFREETRTEDGGVRGSFGYVESGVLRITEYTADQQGYRCHETIRYLVEPGRGTFVPAETPHVTKAGPGSDLNEQWNLQMQSQNQENNVRQRSTRVEADSFGWETPRQPKKNQQSWSKTQFAQPARVLGKKVIGHYKDFTSEPAVGGTAAVTAWDSAHNSELRDEDIFGSAHQDLHQRKPTRSKPTVGGTLVWPVTEDGMRVVWQPF